MGELSSMSWPIEGNLSRAYYLRTMQIPPRRGRLFTGRDGASSQKVVVVNEAFVRRFWPEQDGVGKHIGAAAAFTK
jgi:hypothetical protein